MRREPSLIPPVVLPPPLAILSLSLRTDRLFAFSLPPPPPPPRSTSRERHRQIGRSTTMHPVFRRVPSRAAGAILDPLASLPLSLSSSRGNNETAVVVASFDASDGKSASVCPDDPPRPPDDIANAKPAISRVPPSSSSSRPSPPTGRLLRKRCGGY